MLMFVVGTVVGSFVGVSVMCLLITASREDRITAERWNSSYE